MSDVGPAQSVVTGSVVTLDGSKSSGINGNSPISYQWSLLSKPAGSTAQLSSLDSPKPSFTADIAGEYKASLTVSDGTATTTKSTTITAYAGNAPPVAHAGAAQNVVQGTVVNLDGSASSDANGDLLSYSWVLSVKPSASDAKILDSTSVKPNFTADVPGEYKVSLTVSDGKVSSDAVSVSIAAVSALTNSAPMAEAGNSQNVIVGTQVTLDGSKSSDANGDLINYAWTLVSKPTGSGAVLNDPSSAKPTFNADRPGTYIASLVVNDGKLSSAPASTSVTATVVNAAPVADAGVGQQVTTGTRVLLDGSKSSDADRDQITFDWVLSSRPAGSTAVLTSPTSAQPSFPADLVGTYVASLAVFDGKVYSDKATVSVTATAANVPPVASARGPGSVIVDESVTLDGSMSSDANGDPINYAWALVSKPLGSAAVLSDPVSAKPTFVADKVGTYVAALVVNDGKTNSARSAPVAVSAFQTNTAPDADAGKAQDVLVGSVVTLDASKSSDANGDQIQFNWNLSTKPTASASALSSPNSAKPTFTADAAGVYVATLIVNDGRIDSTPVTVSVTSTVANVAPIAKAGANQNVVVGASVSLNGLDSSDANGDKLTYRWTLSKPPGSAANLSSSAAANPVFNADAAGTYVAQLVVNDGQVDSKPASVTVTAATLNVAPIASAVALQNVATGTDVTLDGSGSSDANGDALSYSWALISKPSDSAAVLTNPTWAKPTFKADKVGTYVARLVVSDGQAKSDPATVTVEAGTAVSGTLATSQKWTKDKSPYAMTDSIIVPSGVTLAIEPGVRVWGNGKKIKVEGTLKVAGSSGDLVSLSDVDIVPAGKAGNEHLIDISYAKISGGKLYPSTPSITYGKFLLTDSSISRLGAYIDLWAPSVAVIERNSFSDTYGVSYLIDETCSANSILIRYNLFSSWNEFAIQVRSSFGSGCVAIRYNSMRPGVNATPALKLPANSAGTVFDARYNDWGVTTAIEIEKVIYGAQPDPTAGSVEYSPFLTGPDLATPPAAARVNPKVLR